MMFRKMFAPLALFAVVLGGGMALSAELEKRIVTPIAEGHSLPSIEEAVDGALVAKGWTIGEKVPGRTLASITVRERHTANIAVNYDSTSYTISLLSSEGLKQNDKKGTIHGTYVRWTRNLVAAINARLVRGASPPPSVYAPPPAAEPQAAPAPTPAPVPEPAPQPPG